MSTYVDVSQRYPSIVALTLRFPVLQDPSRFVVAEVSCTPEEMTLDLTASSPDLGDFESLSSSFLGAIQSVFIHIFGPARIWCRAICDCLVEVYQDLLEYFHDEHHHRSISSGSVFGVDVEIQYVLNLPERLRRTVF